MISMIPAAPSNRRVTFHRMRLCTRSALVFVCCVLVLSCKAKKEEHAEAGKAELRIQDFTGKPDLTYTERTDGKTSVLGFMQELQKTQGLAFSGQKSSLGFLVTSINGIKNKPSCPCWIFSINGRLANKGVSEITLTKGDTVRWCYLKYEDRSKCAKSAPEKKTN